jgi:dihydroorotate dehydrogenase
MTVAADKMPDSDLISGATDLVFDPPWMNAAGSLGFLPPARGSWEYEALGAHCAFVTNPVSLYSRTPAAERGVALYEGGFLLHSGLPNPGLKSVLRRYAHAWAQAGCPVWVHLVAENPQDTQRMVRQLEGIEGVAAVELGFAPQTPARLVLAMVQAAAGELPVVAQISLESAGAEWLEELRPAGASAVSLGAPRGVLQKKDGGWISGRLYGPGLLPQALAAVRVLKPLGLPVIASGGVFRRKDGEALRAAGAAAVQLDAVLWRGWMD